MKKVVLTVIITAVISISGTVLAVNTINASDVSYDSTHSVKDKIDDLYTASATLKNLTQTTTVASNNLVNGITAYDNNGNLITGNLNTNCESGSLVWDQNKVDNGYTLLNYKPTILVIYNTNTNNADNIYYYNSNVSSDFQFRGDSTPAWTSGAYERITINDNNVVLSWGSGRLNKTIYYTACR